MKKSMIILMTLLLLFTSAAGVSAREVNVLLNGSPLAFDVPAQIIGDRTMVPMRKIFEELGCMVSWQEEERVVIAISADNKIIALQIDQKKLFVNDMVTGDKKEVELDVPAMIVNDRTLVPARAVSEALNAVVGWDEATYTVTIIK